jgi:hypothetical protein
VLRLPVISQNHSSLTAVDPRFSTFPIPRAGLCSRGLGSIEKTVAPMGARRLRVPEGTARTQDPHQCRCADHIDLWFPARAVSAGLLGVAE